jgi:hypothetical protein
MGRVGSMFIDAIRMLREFAEGPDNKDWFIEEEYVEEKE